MSEEYRAIHQTALGLDRNQKDTRNRQDIHLYVRQVYLQLMSVSGGPPGRPPQVRKGTTGQLRHWRPIFVLAVVAGVVVLTLAAGQVGGATDQIYQASENASADEQAPELVSGSRVNDTAFELLITDNQDVDEGSIGANDFILEAGTISHVNVTESGRNATVVVHLAQRVRIDDLTVAIAHGGGITDESGNTLDASSESSSVIVSGMDGFPPAIRGFDASFRAGGPVHLSIRTSERLSGLNVSIFGPVDDRLTRSDFTFNKSGYTYETTYVPAADGDVTFDLINATDENGNTAPVNIRQEVFVDTNPPKAVAGIDFASSSNLTLSFDAGRSTDENAIASYEWDFGDGGTATGKQASHTFAPGNYTVTLTVTDDYGNEGTDTLELNLTSGAGNVTDVSGDQLDEIRRRGGPVVSVDRQREGGEHSAFVDIRDATGGQPFTVGRTEAALASREGFALEQMNVTLSENESARLGVSTDDAGSVATAASAANTTAIGGITVVHDLPEGAVDNVTFRFVVDADRIDAADGSPEKVSVRRFHDDSWNTLPTTVREATNQTVQNATNRTVQLSALSPGFSRFAIVVERAGQTSEGQQSSPTATPAQDPTPTPASSPTATPGPENQATATPAPSEDRRFAVTNVSLSQSTVAPGDTVLVNATVENRGNTTGAFRAGLVVNGTVVDRDTVGLEPGQTGVAELRFQANDTGTHRVSVNGTLADQELSVGTSGGLLGSVMGVFGFLPVGLLATVGKFVVLPLAVVYLLLKGLAMYLGY
jgi:PKD repeat protein